MAVGPRVDLEAYSVEVAPDWVDITDSLEGDPKPWTLAREDGGGALQFSSARYVSGAVPNPTLMDLERMVRDFGGRRGLGEPLELVSEDVGVLVAGGSYTFTEQFFRIWYVSDGRSFVFVTYTAEPPPDIAEVQASEAMVRTVRF